ncbi:hypothetical protein [Tabrizicola sp.]|uniref:hypothetical protein n=1 Tax=Tabrizicola sp. TaxID=2005166 RepID=UPI0035B27D9C
MNLKALNKVLRRRFGAAQLHTSKRKKPITVSENIRKQVLFYLALRAEADGTEIYPTKQRIADELGLSKRAVQLAITTLLLPTPFGGPPILHKDGVVMTRKGPADKFRIDLAALWKLPEIEVDDDVLERTEFTPEVNDVHPTREPGSPHPVNEVHPERPPEKPKKDLGKTRQVFSAVEDRDFNRFLDAFPSKAGIYEGTHTEYLLALKRGATIQALLDAAATFAKLVNSGCVEPSDPADWLRRDLWKGRVPYHPGGIVRGQPTKAQR